MADIYSRMVFFVVSEIRALFVLNTANSIAATVNIYGVYIGCAHVGSDKQPISNHLLARLKGKNL